MEFKAGQVVVITVDNSDSLHGLKAGTKAIVADHPIDGTTDAYWRSLFVAVKFDNSFKFEGRYGLNFAVINKNNIRLLWDDTMWEDAL
jgi:hypothetical protein